MAQNNMGLDVAACCSSLLPSSPPSSSPPSSPSSSVGQATRRVPRFSARAAPSRRARTNSNWTGSRWDTKVLFPEQGWIIASIAFGNWSNSPAIKLYVLLSSRDIEYLPLPIHPPILLPLFLICLCMLRNVQVKRSSLSSSFELEICAASFILFQ